MLTLVHVAVGVSELGPAILLAFVPLTLEDATWLGVRLRLRVRVRVRIGVRVYRVRVY